MTLLRALALCLCCTGTALAQAVPPPPQTPSHMLPKDEQAAWNAIGRVNISGLKLGGMCSGTLIAPDLVLTAAHCVFLPSGRQARPTDIHFVAGWRSGNYVAHRIAARVTLNPGLSAAATTSPDNAGRDVALIVLRDPIQPKQVAALPVAEMPHFPGPLTLIGYRADRPHAPSRQQDCRIAARMPDVVALTCDVYPGASGGPVLWQSEDGWRVVGLVSGRLSGAEPMRSLSPLVPFHLLPDHLQPR